MKYLVIFAIGPVQSYIEASRSSRDLFASSAILSSIALAGIQTAQGFGEVIYPKLDSGEPPAGVPHRFTITTEKDPAVAAKAVQEAVQKQWKEEIAGKVRSYLAHIWGDGEWQNIFDRQVNNWLEFYWVAVTYHPASHSECIGKANIAMAAHKSIRNFPQIAEKGVKCTLTGVQSALTDSTKMWDKVREKMNDTISDDGDPVDVLVLSPVPVITGVVVRCRPIGMLKMEDEAGGDAKLLAVPVDRLSSLYRAIKSPRDLPELTTAQISHFFQHYKDLEPGKWVKIEGWVGAEEAKQEILAGVERYKKAKKKPKF